MSSIKEIDSRFLKISKKAENFTLDLINPTNGPAEKKLFFFNYSRYTQYNPNFTYLKKVNFEKEKTELDMLKKESAESSIAEKIISSRIDSLKKEITLLESVNTKKFCNNSKKVYGEPNKKEVKMAQEILCEKYSPLDKNINSNKLLEEIKKHLKNTGFEAELKENMSANASVNLSKRKLYLKSDARFNENDLNRFIVHEIETHIFRYLNGINQPIKTLSLGFGGDYLKTEEGLAALNEKLFKTSSKEQEKIFAGRLYAVNYALTHDFFDTFEEMKKYFTEEEAYQISQRVKRGIIKGDKGAFTKDYCYYSGFILIDKYYNEGKPLEELYFGKISTAEINKVKKISGIIAPNFIPAYHQC